MKRMRLAADESRAATSLCGAALRSSDCVSKVSSKLLKSRVLLHFGLYAGYLLLAALLTFPLVRDLGGSFPMPSYIRHTPWLHSLWAYLWWLWHVDYSVFHLHQLPGFTDSVFYPVGIYCWSFLLQGALPFLLFAPFAFAFSTIAAGNLLLLFSLANSAYAAFLLARHCMGDARAAFAAGIAFAFACPQMANAQGHILVVAAVPLIPWFILCLVRLRDADGFLNLSLLILTSTLLMFAYWYFDLFALIFTLLFIVFGGIGRATLLNLIKAAAVCSIIAVPIAFLIYSQDQIVLSSSVSTAKEWSVDLAAFFVPSQDHTLWGDGFQEIRRGFGANPTIQSAYLGYTLLVMSLLGILGYGWRTLRLWLAGFLLFSALALGPLLHVGGQAVFRILDCSIMVPLPFLLLHKLPLFSALRDCSMFLVVSTLCLALLTGYGVKWILERSPHRAVVYCCIITVMLVDQLAVPFPIYHTEPPPGYARLAAEPVQGTLVDVPLRQDLLWNLYYQSVHKKRLLIGSFSRLDEFYQNYPEHIPFVEVLKNPRSLVDTPPEDLNTYRDSAQWAVVFFDIDTIVLHKNLMSDAQCDATRAFIGNVLEGFTLNQFEEGNLIIYQLMKKCRQPVQEDLFIDFQPAAPRFYLARGWSGSEMWGDSLSVRWSEGATSDLYVYLQPSASLSAEFRVFPFAYPGSPNQALHVYLNDNPLDTLEFADRKQWQTFQLALPGQYLRTGVNHLQFRYGFSARPSSVIPSSRDDRELSVAFDYIRVFRGAPSRAHLAP